jgi:hypothetical protein
MEMKKILAAGIIILFISVAVAPSINQSVVKASQDDDLVEVTTQACGIQGYGNTTVKLTREQYQNLEQYLVEFRERLNQTSTREEAVPIFKVAVVELNKYGLLPKGMSVNRAYRLLTNQNNQRFKLFNTLELDPDANYLCLVSGLTTETMSFGPINNLAQRSLNNLLGFLYDNESFVIRLINLFENISVWLKDSNHILFLWLIRLLLMPVELFATFVIIWIVFGGYVTSLLPFGLLSLLTFGCSTWEGYKSMKYYPSSGWIFSIGINGVKKFESNELQGIVREETIQTLYSIFYPGALGFTGLKLSLYQHTFFLGSAFKVKIGTDRPPKSYEVSTPSEIVDDGVAILFFPRAKDI